MTIYAYTDGASRGNPGESGIGILLKNEEGSILYSGSGYIGLATNNIAEYEALLICLQKVSGMECSKLIVHSDSQLIVRQILGEYRVKDKKLQKYYSDVNQAVLSARFVFEIKHIDREQNRDADRLANIGIDSKKKLRI